MPLLDHYRKQAKRYLRWHREGYFPVATLIRETLPRFSAIPDLEVMAACFKLCDAQELVARKHGYDNWFALANGAHQMPTHSDMQRAFIKAAEPQLFVSDLERAIEFYTEKLGFDAAFTYGDPVFYAQVTRDGARLNLRWIEGAGQPDSQRRQAVDALSATMTLDDAKPLFLEYQEAGVVFHQRLRAEPWGAPTFIVSDPDGNLLAFAGG